MQYNHEIINDYLTIQCELIKNVEHKYSPNSNHIALIIEPRNHFLLEAVCRNVMYFLPAYFNLVIVGYDYEFIKSKLHNIDFEFIKLEKNDLCYPDEYNLLLQNIEFWNKIKGEHIILFQTDSYLTKHMTTSYIENILYNYAYVGGIYNMKIKNNLLYVGLFIDNNKNELSSTTVQCNFGINGGFSYRKKSAMIKCIEEINNNDILNYRTQHNLNIDYYQKNKVFGEDTYFQNSLEILGYNMPSLDVCVDFCTNLPYDIKKLHNSYAIHGFDKPYYDNKIVVSYIRPSLDYFVNNH